MKKPLAALLLSGLLAVPLSLGLSGTPAVAQSSLRAAAVVNDEVISVLDVILRLRMAIVQSGLEDTPEARERLTNPVLRSLIDEHLQLQEARRLEIEIAPEQVDDGLDRLAEQNNMTRAQFMQTLREQGVLEEAMREQIRAQLAWREVVARRLAPQVTITEEEIDDMMRRIKEDVSQSRVRVAEIFIPFDSPAEEGEARTTAQRLLDELQQGAPFQRVAQQFSQAPTASVGGDLGWVTLQELPEEVAEAVRGMEPRELAGPIRTIGGYYLIALIGRQAAQDISQSVQLARFVVPAADEAEMQAATAQAARLSEDVQSCAQASRLAEEYAGEGVLPTQAVDDLDPRVRSAVEGLQVGDTSAPVPEADGAAVYTLCLREGAGISRDAIEADLRSQRLELLGRRYMRDLRRDANVEIRI
jgi:peptidyl-prolyl cis-trans isomerase SurA